MIQATTPTLTLTVPDTFDLSTARTILVSFQQYNTTLTKTIGEGVWLMEPNIIAVTLSQEETLMFMPKRNIDVQVNWIGDNGGRFATDWGTIPFGPNMIPEVINA